MMEIEEVLRFLDVYAENGSWGGTNEEVKEVCEEAAKTLRFLLYGEQKPLPGLDEDVHSSD
jgi:hypothetical protein